MFAGGGAAVIQTTASKVASFRGSRPGLNAISPKTKRVFRIESRSTLFSFVLNYSDRLY